MGGCQPQEASKPVNQPEQTPNRFATLLSFYPKIDFDTLLVTSAENPDESTFVFHGKPLDSISAAFFPETFSEVHWAEPPAIFACFQFPMNNGCIGLITRVPSVYVSSSIQLFVLDTAINKLYESLELAQEVGDAGDALYKKSWLFKETSARLKVLIWNKETHDHSVDEEPDTVPENWDSFFIVHLNNNRQDTVSKDSATLTRTFGYLLNKQPAANTTWLK